jgi:hypothetical protein
MMTTASPVANAGAADGGKPATPAAPARRRALTAIGSLGLLAGGCGGTDIAGVGSGGTGQMAASFSTGPISGFGSVIVNGVKYDDSAASIVDDLGIARSLGQLSIGMVVEVEGTSDDVTGLGAASLIRIVSELKGTVDAIDTANGTLTVLGVLVRVLPATVWDDTRGLGALAVGDLVEVYGFYDTAAAAIRASRVEKRPVSEAAAFKLRGPVAALSTATRSFRVGGLTIEYGSAASLPANLADGMLVRLTGANRPRGGVWRPDRIATATADFASVVATARLDGTISGVQSAARFTLAGLQVDAGGAVFTGGTAASLRDGVRLRVVGAVSGRTVRARSVEIREGGGSSAEDGAEDEAEVKGTIVRFGRISDFTVRDPAGRLFLVDGSVADDRDGTAKDLKVGTVVEVRGRRGTVLLASRIEIER